MELGGPPPGASQPAGLPAGAGGHENAGAQLAGYWWPEEGAWPGRPGGGSSGLGEDGSRNCAPVAVLPEQTAGAEIPLQSGTAGPNRLRLAWRRLVAALAAAGAFLAKFGALLLKVKYVGLVLSMFVSVAAYAWLFGWSFAVGLVLLLLVHEMGHVVVLRRQGVPASAPLFIPFLGAFVKMRSMPRSAYQEAVSGLAGPAFGTAGSVVLAYWADATGSAFLRALAFFGFFVNLFNLLPVLPLDGGRAAGALHPALWLAGLVGLLVIEVYYPSPIVPLVLILGGVELWRRWVNRRSPASRAYHTLAASQRWAVAASYLLLVVVTLAGAHATYVARGL